MQNASFFAHFDTKDQIFQHTYIYIFAHKLSLLNKTVINPI